MSGHPVEIKQVSEWNQTLRSATANGETVVVDFWATWCGPCKAIAPRFDQLAKEYSHVKFVRVDVDAQKAIAQKYQISAMPTFLAIKAGQVVDTLKGADPSGLGRLVASHAGPNPPVAPLTPEAEAAKVAGNDAFKAADYSKAIEHYTTAIELAPNSFTLLGNRSLSYLKSTPPNPTLALADAEKSVEIAPTWGKGWVRVGESLVLLERKEEAVKAFDKAVATSEGTVKNEAKTKLGEVKKSLGWH